MLFITIEGVWEFNCQLFSFKSGRSKLWRRQWHPTPVLLPGKSLGRRSLVGCSPWGHTESDTTERLHLHFSLWCTGEGNGNPLQCSCLENPRDGGAWWAAISGVAQSQTRLKWLSSSSSRNKLKVRKQNIFPFVLHCDVSKLSLCLWHRFILLPTPPVITVFKEICVQWWIRGIFYFLQLVSNELLLSIGISSLSSLSPLQHYSVSNSFSLHIFLSIFFKKKLIKIINYFTLLHNFCRITGISNRMFLSWSHCISTLRNRNEIFKLHHLSWISVLLKINIGWYNLSLNFTIPKPQTILNPHVGS